jgi:multidrug transporter EmrE-like cation transporter
MVLGIGVTLFVGLVWMVVGIIYSNATKDKSQFNLFMLNMVILYAVIAFLLPYIGSFEFVQAIIPSKYMPVKPLNPIAWSNFWKLALLTAPSNLAGFAGFFILSYAMRMGSHSVAWGIMQSAIVLPFLTGWLILGDNVKIGNLCGMLIIIMSLIILVFGKVTSADKSAGKSENSSNVKNFLILTFLAFLCTGIQQSCTLLPNKADIIFPNTEPFTDAVLAWRIPLGSLGSLVIWVIVSLLAKVKLSFGQFKNSLIYAIVVFIGQTLFYVAVDILSNYKLSGVVYPLAIGCCIVSFSLFCVIFRHEKLNILEKVGLGVMVLGLCTQALATVF